MKTIRILSLGIAMCFLMTFTTFAEGDLLISRIRTNHNNFQDAQDIWCSDNIDICYQTGLMEGTSVNSFSPSTPLTYAQIAIISSRLQNILSGGTGTFRKATQNEKWYTPAYQAFSVAAKDAGKSLPEDLEYADFPSEHWTRIRTNNVIERLNREIRRRTRVVGCFPDGNSALMLVCARLRHVAGTQWGNKKYMNMKHLDAVLDDASIAG